ncbi:unnamed protein product [Rotaria sp. Silwood1]|nr:unnamed protein product [Rotaria sp. Silwood1]CAF1633520.1 unnamed protein product [Rotaria sp. Silwood1]CAF3824399.1 unnamed protein product [Rotaria sp. Silwood1]CAF5009532.1 unnamed protein product [Rotaria sp. Silwood1]CAF5080806.1 unnamed protein product [Rotaria sp. Silwood1]
MKSAFVMSTTTLSTVLITSLKLIQTDIFRIGGPILIFFGTSSCLFSYIIFRQKNLRKNPCTIYFLSFNLSNLLLIYSSLLPVMLEIGYNIKPNSYSLIQCRFRLYALTLFDCLSSLYLILASIDRMCVTSPNAFVRSRSNNYFAYKSIIIGTLFCMIFSSHALIFQEIVPSTANDIVCNFKPGIYMIFLAYYSLIKGILMPFLMILFGLLAMKNIRRLRRIHVSTEGRSHSYGPSTKDRKLILLVLMNIIVYVLFDSMMTIYLMYEQITQYYIKNDLQKQMDTLWGSIATFGLYSRFCICGYINLFVSRIVCQQIKKIFLWGRIFFKI